METPLMLVDVREKRLLEALASSTEFRDDDRKKQIKPVALDVADVQFASMCSKTECTKERDDHREGEEKKGEVRIDVAIERKTIADLCASIKDGRYREQKYRLTNHVMANGGRVCYVIEGAAGERFEGLKINALAHGLQPSALQSCVCDLMLLSNIHVMFTRDVEDTADVLVSMWKRHLLTPCHRHGSGADAGKRNSPADVEYLQTITANAKRNKNITPHTCYIMQLCQVPGVSYKTAQILAGRWTTMLDMYTSLAPLERASRIEALASLPTIGKKGAERLVDHLFVSKKQDPPSDPED